jgi:heat shock protein HslJ
MKGRELDKKKPTIYINADENAVSGNATCNDYRFEFKMNDKQVQMNRGISTKMYCEDEMEIERSFMGLMGNVSFISQSDEFLYLKDADNKLLIKAKKYKRS